jgi:hypothetical protein
MKKIQVGDNMTVLSVLGNFQPVWRCKVEPILLILSDLRNPLMGSAFPTTNVREKQQIERWCFKNKKTKGVKDKRICVNKVDLQSRS